MTPDTRIINDIDEVVEEVVNEVCDETEIWIKRQIVILIKLIILFIGFIKRCNKDNISAPEGQ